MGEVKDLLFVTLAFWGMILLPVVCTTLMILLLFSKYWLLTLLYVLWIWKDRKTCETGGRRLEFLRSWNGWLSVKRYFTLNLVKEDGATFEATDNYMFCSHPHGLMPFGIVMAFLTNLGGLQELLPYHKPFMTGLALHFNIPFHRDLSLALGVISVSLQSLEYVLNTPGRGKCICMFPGGAREIHYCRPNSYKLILKHRKGFIKIALRTGTNLVPVINFNETAAWNVFSLPCVSSLQKNVARLCNFPLVVPKGDYIVCPRKVPLTVLVGKPINVKKNDHPTQNDIDTLHQLYIEKLIKLFEENKHKYINNASNVFLEIV